jgi:hypothetical protein
MRWLAPERGWGRSAPQGLLRRPHGIEHGLLGPRDAESDRDDECIGPNSVREPSLGRCPSAGIFRGRLPGAHGRLPGSSVAADRGFLMTANRGEARRDRRPARGSSGVAIEQALPQPERFSRALPRALTDAGALGRPHGPTDVDQAARRAQLVRRRHAPACMRPDPDRAASGQRFGPGDRDEPPTAQPLTPTHVHPRGNRSRTASNRSSSNGNSARIRPYAPASHTSSPADRSPPCPGGISEVRKSAEASRRAVKDLAERGLLVVVHGRGTFVAQPAPPQ